MEVYESLVRIISEQVGIRFFLITPESTLIDDLGADSLDIAEIVIALENEFSVDVPDEDVEKMTTVGDIYDYLIKIIK